MTSSAVALCVRRVAEAWHEVVEILDPSDNAVIFAEDAPALARTGPVRDLYTPLPTATFERIIVSPGLRLFDAPWTLAFLNGLTDGLVSRGSIVVPFTDGRGRLLSLPTLQTWFRQDGEPVGSKSIEFERPEALPPADSLLPWLLREERGFAAEFWQEHAAASAAAVRYLIQGLSYKAPVLSHIVGTRLPRRSDLRHLDLGSGPGFVGAELLLERDVGIVETVNVDRSSASAILAGRTTEHLAARCAGQFSFVREQMEYFEFPDGFDIVTLLGGTVIYVPREQQSIVLKRAWDSLRPGGILVLLENVKAERFVQDYDRMLDAHELDRLLERFGPIGYVGATAAVDVPSELVGDRTVFRIVQKPSTPAI